MYILCKEVEHTTQTSVQACSSALTLYPPSTESTSRREDLERSVLGSIPTATTT